ncbi:MAG: NUDIX domain-containing protein [archaeon]|nr:NUDIX domain-containing protein [Nanoarchaeota archaeon]
MAEKLEVYDLKGNLIGVQDRKEFYDEIKAEFKRTGKITKLVKTIRLLLMNSKGRIYLQKRSNLKNENPGLYDKTVGGHVAAGDSYNMTTIRECAEELGFPASILSAKEFDRAIKVTDLNIVGVFKEVDHKNYFESVRITKKGNSFVQPTFDSSYIGYYNGAIRFVDGECSGIEVFSLNELEDEMRNSPEKFTEDIKFMIKKYKKYLKPIN